MAELIPCPWCGNTMESFAGLHKDGFAHGSETLAVECDSCECVGPFKPTMEEAIAAWNRRTPPPQAAGGEPVAWGHDDGREIHVITDKIKKIWLAANEIHVAHYNIPLYAHANAAGNNFVAVPKRPTDTQLAAAIEWQRTEYVCDPLGDKHAFYDGIYRAMLAAAPAQPTGANQ